MYDVVPKNATAALPATRERMRAVLMYMLVEKRGCSCMPACVFERADSSCFRSTLHKACLTLGQIR